MGEQPRTGSLTVGARVLWRQLRSAPAAAVTIFIATLLASVFVTAVPRVLERVSEEALPATLMEAEPEQRNFRAVPGGHFTLIPRANAFAPLVDRGDQILELGFPRSLRSIVSHSQYVVDTPEFELVSFPDGREEWFTSTFRFRYQQGIEGHMTLVDGTLPVLREPIPMLVGEGCPADRLATEDFEESHEGDCVVAHIPVMETAVTAETAAALTLEVGDLVAERGITNEKRVVAGDTFVLAISGIVELSDVAEEFWFADAALHRPRIEENPDFRLVFATGLMRPQAFGTLVSTFPHLEFGYTWRYFVAPELVEASHAEELRSDVARIVPPNDEVVITSLDSLIASYLDERTLTLALLSTVMIGVVVVAVGLVLVLARLIADRQASGTILTRDRGASRGQLTLTAAYTGMALVVPATVAGYLATTAIFPGTGWLLPGRGSAALALGGAGAMVVAGWPYVFGRLGDLQRRGLAWESSSSGRRLVAEVFVLIAAVVSVILLRRRGLAHTPGNISDGIDGLLAIAPSVVGLAAGLVVLRLMGPLMRLLSWLGGRRADATLFIGFRRLIAQSPASRTPIVVVVVAVTVAVFSSVVRIAVSDGQEGHSWQVAGGDIRVEAGTKDNPFPIDVDLAELVSGRPWAAGAVFSDTRLLGLARSPRVRLLAIDFEAYEEVLSGSGFEVPDLQALSGSDADDGPAPVLVSSRWDSSGAPRPGTEFALQMGPAEPEVVVAGVVGAFPSLPVTEPFVVIGLDDLQSAVGELSARPTVLFIDAEKSDTQVLAEKFIEAVPRAVVTSRYDVRADLAAAPFPLWVDRGLAIAVYIALVFAAVASLSLLTMTANRRQRDLAYLRTLGMTGRQATAITALEQVPPLIVSILFGAVAGSAVARLLAPALNIEAFTGELLPVEIVVDPGTILAITGLMLLMLVVSSVSFAVATRDHEYAAIIRVGDE